MTKFKPKKESVYIINSKDIKEIILMGDNMHVDTIVMKKKTKKHNRDIIKLK